MMYDRKAIDYFRTLMVMDFPQKSNTIYQYWNKLWKMLIHYHLGQKSKYYLEDIPETAKENIYISFESGNIKIHNIEGKQVLLETKINPDLKNILTIINKPIVANIIHKDTIDKAELKTPEQLQFLLQEVWQGVVYKPIWCICDAIRQLKEGSIYIDRVKDILRISCELNIKFYFLIATRIINNYNKNQGYSATICGYELTKKDPENEKDKNIKYVLTLMNNKNIYLNKSILVTLDFSDNEYFKDCASSMTKQLYQLFGQLFDIISTKENHIPEDNINQIGKLLIDDIDTICISSEEMQAKLKAANEATAKVIRTPEQEDERLVLKKAEENISKYITYVYKDLVVLKDGMTKYNCATYKPVYTDELIKILYKNIDLMPDDYEFAIYQVKRLRRYKSSQLFVHGYNKTTNRLYIHAGIAFDDDNNNDYIQAYYIGSKTSSVENAPIVMEEASNASGISNIFGKILKSSINVYDPVKFNRFKSNVIDKFKKCKNKESRSRNVVVTIHTPTHQVIFTNVFIGNHQFESLTDLINPHIFCV